VSLSEQQLVSCSGAYGPTACEGGWYYDAFNYAADNIVAGSSATMKSYGVNSESEYPYTESQTTQNPPAACKLPSMSPKSCRAFAQVSQNEADLMTAVATKGPISVAVYVADSFQRYASGIYTTTDCDGQEDANHAVLVVGYGTDKGKDYWIVKNSWDTWWGESGYMRMARNNNNMCLIAKYAFYPVLPSNSTVSTTKAPAKTKPDTDKNCRAFATRGECTKSAPYMNLYCATTCSNCAA